MFGLINYYDSFLSRFNHIEFNPLENITEEILKYHNTNGVFTKQNIKSNYNLIKEYSYNEDDCVNIPPNSQTEYTCCICISIFNNPHKLNCGHTFCKECLYTVENKLCPLCRKPFMHDSVDIKPNKQILDDILSFEFECKKCNKNHNILKCELDKPKFKCNNCNEIVDKDNLLNHSIKECVNKLIECDKCKKYISQENYNYNHQLYCAKNRYTCTTCNEDLCLENKFDHICQKIKCYNCDKFITFQKIDKHQKQCGRVDMKFKRMEWNQRK